MHKYGFSLLTGNEKIESVWEINNSVNDSFKNNYKEIKKILYRTEFKWKFKKYMMDISKKCEKTKK